MVILYWYCFPIGRRETTPELTERNARLIGLLQSRRRELGLTQEQVAVRSGIGIDTFRAIEQGKSKNPGFFFIVDLSRALEISLDALAD